MKISRYGKKFDTSLYDDNGNQIWDDLGIEMWCIKQGETWCDLEGHSISYHFEQVRKIIWPELDSHRWHNLCRDEILTHKVCTLLGCGSSGKTHSAAWISLVDYWCFPEITCVLVSSTDIRGLKKRVWGEIVDLWEKGVDRFPKLAGHLLDSALAITTDNLEDCEPGQRKARDMRKGIFGVPCVQNGAFVGLSKFIGIKQKRMRLVADEACFPAGTLVDTPNGRVEIQDLNPGDLILNCMGTSRIRHTMKKRSSKIVKITSSSGRVVFCTPTHPFLTQFGWKCACDLDQTCYMVGQYEAMQILQNPNGQQNFLQSELQREMDDYNGRGEGVVLHKIESEENRCSYIETTEGKAGVGSAVHCQKRGKPSDEEQEHSAEDGSNSEANWPPAEDKRRQRNWGNKSRVDASKNHAGASMELCSQDWNEKGVGLSAVLQVGFGHSRAEAWSGGRWEYSQLADSEAAGQKEGGVLVGDWVDSVEIHEQEDFGSAGSSEIGVDVYNLEIEGHPSFSVSGFLVHNSMMGSTFLSAFANLNKNEDFRAIVLGNPNDPLDPLGKAAEPKEGWTDDYLEPTKTACWDTRFMNGRAVNLVGLDSPNFDFPPDKPTKYKYLISKEKIEETLSFFPKDSIEYYSQCVGTMKIGTMAKRVLTRAECNRFKAQERAQWLNEDRTRIYFVDAAYGGDRCVGGSAEFGLNVDGLQVLELQPPKVIPITVSKKIGKEDFGAEDQIALFVRQDCDDEGIPASNMGHDSTGHGSLGTALAEHWSAETHPIDSGGAPTPRPVSADLKVLDEETGMMRPKLCNEHFDRLVSEFNFMFRLAVLSGQIRGLPDECMEEFCARRWDRVKDDKYWVEPKDKPHQDPRKAGFKQRMGRSPDMADWAAGILEMARRKGFVIASVGKEPTKKKIEDWYSKEAKRLEEQRKNRQLQGA